MSYKTSDVFRAGFLTVDGTLNSNNSQLYFRPLQGPAYSVSGDFFSLSPNQTTDPSLRLNHWSSNGSLLSYGYVYDSEINPPPIQVGTGLHLVGGVGGIIYSSDETKWVLAPSVFQGTNSYCSAIASNGVYFLAGGLAAGKPTIYSSSNGKTWFPSLNATALFGADLSGCKALATSGPLWVAGGEGLINRIIYSYDGTYWYPSTSSGIMTGACYALAYNGSTWVAGGKGTNSILYSNDGLSWYGSSTGTNTLTRCLSVAWNGVQWIAGGVKDTSGALASSYDGATWTPIAIPGLLRTSCNAIAANGTLLVAGGTDISNNTLIYSYNGTNWFNGNQTSILTACNTLTWTDNAWFAGGVGTNSLLTSTDGINWVPVPNASALLVASYASAVSSPLPTTIKNQPSTPTNSVILMGGNSSILISSIDGITWAPVPSVLKDFSGGTCQTVRWNGKQWVAGFSTSVNKIGYSYDGITWTASSSGTGFLTSGCNAVESSGGTGWLAGGNQIISSSDGGITWTSVPGTSTLIGPGVCKAIVWSGSRWVAGTTNPTNPIIYSNNGTTWLTSGTTLFTVCNGLAYNGTLWVAVGNRIAYSTDGITWINSSITTGTWNTVAWNGFLWLAGGTSGLAYSYDGLNWTTITQSIVSTCNSITWSGSLWIATGTPVLGSQSSAYSYNGMTWIPSTNSLNFIGTGQTVAANRALVNAGITINPPVFNQTSSTIIGKVVYSTGLNNLYTSSTLRINDASGYIDMSGFIGINCIPQRPLDVSGAANIRGDLSANNIQTFGQIGINCVAQVSLDVSGAANIRGDLSANSIRLKGTNATYSTTITTQNFNTSQSTQITQTTPSAGYVSIGSSQLNNQTLFVQDGTTTKSGYIGITDGAGSSIALQLRGGNSASIIPNGTSTSLRLGAASDVSNNIVLSNDTTVNTQLNVAGTYGRLQIAQARIPASPFPDYNESQITTQDSLYGIITIGSSQTANQTLWIRDDGTPTSGYIGITDGTRLGRAVNIRGGTNCTICPNDYYTTLTIGASTISTSNVVLTNNLTTVNTQLNIRGDLSANNIQTFGQIGINCVAQRPLDVSGAANIRGDLSANNIRTFGQIGINCVSQVSLDVSGAANIRGDLSANNIQTFGQIGINCVSQRPLDVSGSANIRGDLSANNIQTFGQIGINCVALRPLDVSGAANIRGDLSANNIQTFGQIGINCVALRPLDVSGAANIRGDLSANNIQTFGQIGINCVAQRPLDVSGAANIRGDLSANNIQTFGQIGINCVAQRPLDVSGAANIRGDLSANSLTLKGTNATFSTLLTTQNFNTSQQTQIVQTCTNGGKVLIGSSVDASSVITILDSGPNTGIVKIGGNGADSVVLVGGGGGISPVIQTDASGYPGALVLGASTRNPFIMYVSDATSAGSGNVTITNGLPGKSGIQLTGGAINNSIHPNSIGTSLRLGAASDVSNNIVLTSTATTVNTQLNVASVAGGATNQLKIVNTNTTTSTINQTSTTGSCLLQLGCSQNNPSTLWIWDQGTAKSSYIDITNGTSGDPGIRLKAGTGIGSTSNYIYPNTTGTSLTLGGVLDASNIVLTNNLTRVSTPLTVNGNLTAPNIVNSIIAGTGITLGGGPTGNITINTTAAVSGIRTEPIAGNYGSNSTNITLTSTDKYIGLYSPLATGTPSIARILTNISNTGPSVVYITNIDPGNCSMEIRIILASGSQMGISYFIGRGGMIQVQTLSLSSGGTPTIVISEKITTTDIYFSP